MKKLAMLYVLMIALLILVIPAAALAEGELPTEPFTWQYLATILGATAATVVIVQVFKLPLDKIWKVPTRVVVYVIALIILETATYFTTGLDISSAALAVFNAFLVAVAAYGTYELTFRYSDEKKKQE